ncbi:MAG TPA: TonB family protein [Pyrinomonadaceae bacterium]|nr:TonB family protein [Pyrinomonadaceae bacterium]
MKQPIPLVRRALRILQILFVVLVTAGILQAQSVDAAKSAEVDQGRIERARALMAAHQLDTAAAELEAVRAATRESALRDVSSVMLMNVYLEEGNYTRAEALLEESYGSDDANRSEDSLRCYFALAGQAINGARSHLSRYRTFGINISDGNLQPEAAKDLDRLRSFIERMVAHAKTISNTRKAYDSLSLLEDVLGLRLALAKDSDEQTKWSAEYASVRETLASSQTQVASLGAVPVLPSSKQSPSLERQHATAPEPQIQNAPVELKATSTTETSVSGINVGVAPEPAKIQNRGSLNASAVKRVLPQYPPVARQMGMAGMVRVYVVFDESGKVIDIPKSEGPTLLRTAAENAARHWLFGPTNNGQAARVSGYIDFNFTL